MSIKPARWRFVWHPVKTDDTERWVWLRNVYVETYGRSKFYYEKENPF